MSNTFPYVKFAGGPTYGNQLIPFTYSNGVLDVPSNWVSGKTLPPTNNGVVINRLGGNNSVMNIGTNLKNYIFNVNWYTDATGTTGNYYKITNASTIRIPTNWVGLGIVTRVQILDTTNLPQKIDTSSYKVSTSLAVPNFNIGTAVFLFDSPVVIQATAQLNGSGASTTIYITLYTQWDH